MNSQSRLPSADADADPVAYAAFARAVADSAEMAYLADYNPAVLPELMRHLAGSTDPGMLAHRAGDPNTPPEALLFLAGICPTEFCNNPVLPLLLLENPALPAEFEPASLGRLLSYYGVPADLLAAVAQLGQPEAALTARLHIGLAGESGANWRRDLEQALAAIPTIPGDDLLLLLLVLRRVPDWLLSRIAAGHNTRLALALAFADGASDSLGALVPVPPAPPALTPTPDMDSLARMLESAEPAERTLAAADPRLTPTQLAAAKEREDWSEADHGVYRAIAANLATPADVLVALARDASALNTGVRRAVAMNPNAPAEALALLADEVYAMDIPLALAAHPNVAVAQRERLIAAALEHAWGSCEPFYRAIALAQPETPLARLAAQARSPHWIERIAVALHPLTPASIRTTLAEDGNRLVRAAAREDNLAARSPQ